VHVGVSTIKGGENKMEFANNQCFLCGAELTGEEPEDETRVDKTYIGPPGRIVEFCSPCPSCGKLIPVCVEARVPTPPTTKAKKKTT